MGLTLDEPTNFGSLINTGIIDTDEETASVNAWLSFKRKSRLTHQMAVDNLRPLGF